MSDQRPVPSQVVFNIVADNTIDLVGSENDDLGAAVLFLAVGFNERNVCTSGS
jgi:hypothetical protein